MSTDSAGALDSAARHHAARCIKARLSGPPETASATRGKPLSGSNSLPASATEIGDPFISTTGPLPLSLGLVADAFRRLWELGLQLSECRAGGILLTERRQRHAELEQRLRRLAAGFVFLIALKEGFGRILVLA